MQAYMLQIIMAASCHRPGAVQTVLHAVLPSLLHTINLFQIEQQRSALDQGCVCRQAQRRPCMPSYDGMCYALAIALSLAKYGGLLEPQALHLWAQGLPRRDDVARFDLVLSLTDAQYAGGACATLQASLDQASMCPASCPLGNSI